VRHHREGDQQRDGGDGRGSLHRPRHESTAGRKFQRSADDTELLADLLEGLERAVEVGRSCVAM
jgi:hypothetical protein